MRYVIETLNLTKSFSHQGRLRDIFRRLEGSNILAVDGVTLKVREGEIFGLLGPNGAGKTTLIKLLSTLLLPSSGSANVFGYDIVQKDYAVRKFIGLVSSDERSFYWRLTGRENMNFFAALCKLSKKEMMRRCEDLFRLFGLNEVIDFRFDEYSAGMKQKFAIARGLLNKPKILFMDEPTRGLDPVAAATFYALIKKEIRNLFGCTIIITTNILSEAEELCDRIGIINHGKLITSGSIDDLKGTIHANSRHHLSIKNLSEHHLQIIKKINGVISLTNDLLSKDLKNNGIYRIGITTDNNKAILTEVFNFILQNNGEILSCNTEEISLEDIFHSFIQRSDAPKDFNGGVS